MARLAAIHITANHPDFTLLLSLAMGRWLCISCHSRVVVHGNTTVHSGDCHRCVSVFRWLSISNIARHGIFHLAERRSVDSGSRAPMAIGRKFHSSVGFATPEGSIEIYLPRAR